MKYLSMNLLSVTTNRFVDELKFIFDDNNYDKIYATSSLTRRDGTKMLFEDYRTFKYILYAKFTVLSFKMCVSVIG